MMIEGSPTPNGDPKWGVEYAVFFNILALMGKTRNIVYKRALLL
jgi:hypothetical protein